MRPLSTEEDIGTKEHISTITTPHPHIPCNQVQNGTNPLSPVPHNQVFKSGLYIKVNVNDVQKKLKSISNNLAKWHKIGQMPLWRMNIKLAKLGIFSSNFSSNGDNN